MHIMYQFAEKEVENWQIEIRKNLYSKCGVTSSFQCHRIVSSIIM